MEHGRSANLVKSSSKRKRKREELEEVKDEEDQLKVDRHSYLKEVKKLRRDLSQLKG